MVFVYTFASYEKLFPYLNPTQNQKMKFALAEVNVIRGQLQIEY